MAETKEAKLARIHDEALRRFNTIQFALQDERRQCLDDRRFYSIAGAQWEGPLQRQFENRPRLEVNKVALSVMRIINEYRANRITVDYVPKDGREADKLADLCDGLYRADEQDSVADEAYDNAFEEAVGGGMGAWRLRTVLEDELDPENEKQRIRIEPIFDADTSVYFDLDAKRQDKSDARYCFVISSMTPEEYKAQFEDNPSSWPKQIYETYFDWCSPDVVYIAEYYRVEERTETLRVFRLLDGSEQTYTRADFDEDETLEQMLMSTGATELPSKRRKTRRVHKYLLSGGRVLEDFGLIAGPNIPIVVTYGKRWFVDNIERCMGHVRLAKDAQRIANMQRSKLAEISALSSVEKPLFDPEQVAGHQWMWEQDNLRNFPYLLLNRLTNPDGSSAPAGPLGYTKPPQVPPALAALIQIAEQDMKDVLGNAEAGEQVRANVAAETVAAVQQRLDMQTFIYVSNFAKAMKRCGEIWLGMAREVYVEEGRTMKTVDAEGAASAVELLQPTIGETGAVEMANDLSRARFDVAVDVGPSSQSKRSATVRTLTPLIAVASDPQTKAVLEALAMMNIEGEGVSDVRAFFRKKLVQMGAVKPSEQEAQEMAAAMQNAQPDPQALYLQAAAQEAQARAMKAQADTALAVAKSEETRAKTVETLANVNVSAQSQAIKTAEAIARATTARPATQS
jgi:Phage P22-like portal protein